MLFDTSMRAQQKRTLENVAIANKLQLETARATPLTPAFPAIITTPDAMPSLKSLNLNIAVL